MSGREELFARLRRLRREGGEAPPVEDAAEGSGRVDAPAPLPAWLARRLARTLPAGARERGPAPPRALHVSGGEPAGLGTAANERGSFAVRRARLPDEHAHGAWRLAEIGSACTRSIAALARDPALAEVDLAGAVYLDIETTGLSGGAGTIPFLVALGSFDGAGGFELWQGFLRGPEEEPALLAEVARRIAQASCIVSYFGKSFDRHRLEDKMRLHGVPPPFDARPHLDLYHPLQRLYREAFDDGRLATLEARLCGVERADDLSGRYAPEAWFDFLAGRAHRLEGVFRHNADDVKSLVVLAAHLGRALAEARHDGRPLGGPAVARALGIARTLAEAGRAREALEWVERALARAAGSAGRDGAATALREARWLRADLLRRAGALEEALAAFEELARGADRLALRACVEAAKLHEHRRRDPAAALCATARARALAAGLPGERGDRRLAAELERRAARLRRRVEARALRDEPPPIAGAPARSPDPRTPDPTATDPTKGAVPCPASSPPRPSSRPSASRPSASRSTSAASPPAPST